MKQRKSHQGFRSTVFKSLSAVIFFRSPASRIPKEKILSFREKYAWLQHSPEPKSCRIFGISAQTIKRFGKFQRKAKQRFDFKKIYDKAKEIEKTKKGITSCELESFLSPDSKLFNIISDDQVKQIDIEIERYYIINLDNSRGPGTHWITLGIFSDTIEFFDPLGC